MNHGLLIRRARPGDGRQLAALLRRSLPAAQLPLTIWSSPRIAPYLESLLAGPGAGFYVLSRGGAMAGVAAWRRLGGRAFLNHLYVVPSLCSRGLGRRLFAASLRSWLGRSPAATVALDVLSTNLRAAGWYSRLGFQVREERSWWLGPPCRVPSKAPEARRLPAAAERQHRAWGFSRFSIRDSRGRACAVGRLPGACFRLPGPVAARDASLRAALMALDPHRRLLVIAPQGPPAPGWRRVARTWRLACPAAFLLARLAAGGRR